MRGFDSILVPLDFSDGTGRILRTALDVLADGGRLKLLHVVEWLPAVTGGTFGIYAHRKDIEKIKTLALEKLRDLAKAHPGVRMETEVKEGKPAAAILEEVAEYAPAVVVMGSHGRSKLDHLLLGSVAERVLRKAPCAVLTVKF